MDDENEQILQGSKSLAWSISSQLSGWYVLIAAIILTIVINLFHVDLYVSSLFFDRSSGEWFGSDKLIFHLIYRCANLPTIFLALCGSYFILKGVFLRTFNHQTQFGCFLLLGLLLGPGLIVNWVCKDSIGRPRPHDVQEFSGEYTFTPVGYLGQFGRNSSFPSGHASVGFYLMLPGLYSWKLKRKKHPSLLIALGLLAGSIVGLTRVVQGGHFLSDVIWSGVIVYYTAILLLKYNLVLDANDELTPYGRWLSQFPHAGYDFFRYFGLSPKKQARLKRVATEPMELETEKVNL